MVRLLVLQITLVATLVIPSVASAGGWAIVVLDEVPGTLTAGVTHRVGFTVLQHGSTPANGLRPTIGISAGGSSQSFEFPAHPDGAPGHYVAEVRFSAAGEWAWEVRPGSFAAQQLGSVKVAETGPRTDPQISPAAPISATEMGDFSRWAQQLAPFTLPLALAAFGALLVVAGSLHPFDRTANRRSEVRDGLAH